MKHKIIILVLIFFSVNSFAQKDTIILQINNLNKESTPIIRPWKTFANAVCFYIANENKKSMSILITRKHVITSVYRGTRKNVLGTYRDGLSEVNKGEISSDTITTNFYIPKQKKELIFLFNNLEYVFRIKNNNKDSIRLFELKYIFIRKSRECIFKNNGVIIHGDKKFRTNINDGTWTTDFIKSYEDGRTEWSNDYIQKEEYIYDTIKNISK